MYAQAFRTLGFVVRQAGHVDSIPEFKALYNNALYEADWRGRISNLFNGFQGFERNLIP